MSQNRWSDTYFGLRPTSYNKNHKFQIVYFLMEKIDLFRLKWSFVPMQSQQQCNEANNKYISILYVFCK